MFFSSSKKDEGKVVGVIDLGSAQVSGAIVRLRSKDREIEKVLAEATQKITWQEEPDLERFWDLTQKAIGNVLHELKTDAKPEKIFFFLSSPFFRSQTEVIKADNQDLIKITGSYLDDLTKQIRNRTQKMGDKIILEDRIMQTKLDGYVTSRPIGQKARLIEINHFLSWAEKGLLVNLRDLVHGEYPQSPVSFNSFSFAVYDIFKDFLPDKDFILFDTGNEITDILIIKNNALAEHLSFPKGKNFLIRELAQNLGTVSAEAETSLSLYAAGRANPQLKTRFEPALAKASSLWLDDCRETLKQAAETVFLPETAYFIGDDPTDNIFAQIVEQADLSESLLSNNKFKAIFVEKLLADGLTHLTGRRPPLTNSWLLAETLFCAKVS